MSVFSAPDHYQADSPTTINGDPFPCMYAPKIVSIFLPVKKGALPDPNDFLFSTKGDGGQLVFNDQDISGSHFAGFFWGFKDNDLMFLKTCLKNNWILEDIIFTKATGTGDVNIWKSHKGTDKLYTQLHWWVDGTGGVVYWISWKVKGPDGMPYF